MGSRIAAHFANAGVPALLLDIVLANQADRNAAAKRGIDNALKQKPASFFIENNARLVTPGNFEDDLHRLSECDWVVEAVTENLEIKRALWQRVAAVIRPGTIVSTNTSGIPLARISEGFSSDFLKNFLGTHFFNPPRYLHLAEVIPGAETAKDVLQLVSEFCDRRLGKGVVWCKDTPNFIGNRIGSMYGAATYKAMMEGDFTIEEVDALTGPLIGVPRTASFRLLDLVGLDVWAFVAQNLYEMIPHDPWRDRILPPLFLKEMLQRGWLGDKSGQGFYKKVGPKRELHAIDWRTLEYHLAAKPGFPSVEAVSRIENTPERLRTFLSGDDRAAKFVWNVLSDAMLYSASLIPEISDRIVEIDRAMRWGYGHELGPFQLWDVLGFETTARRMEEEGRELPETVVRMLVAGARSFYRPADAGGYPRTEYFDLLATNYHVLEPLPGSVPLAEIKRARGVVSRNAGASLIDVGDGVLCLEFHSKMNSLGEDAVSMVSQGVEETARNFAAMIIANEAGDFSAGANLVLLLMAAQDGDWDEIDESISRFQQASMTLKYAPKPVVAAPFGRVLGGGAEWVMHCTRAQAHAELYMGLVELGVGLIPGGGGCKEMLMRLKDPRKIFELIGMAKVSTSAADAQQLGLLHRSDGITMNKDRLIGDAKAVALSLVDTYSPGKAREDVAVSGESGYAAMKLAAWSMKQGGYISEYDFTLAEKLAHVLSGGRLTGTPLVSEQYLLDLEREAFLSLLGQPKTHERIQYMLKNGKPLRN